MKVLVTGNAGFIGFHVAMQLLARGDAVVGFDVVNDYYDPRLKQARLAKLDEAAAGTGRYHFIRADIADRAAVEDCFAGHRFDRVIHLAAQAGVRHSVADPQAYVHSNITGFVNVLEACRHARVAHLTYASTSSVYGANTRLPFSEHHSADHPLQFYAATKRANELMAHSYSHLFGLPTTGLRLFTVYGPWGRPDMAPYRFTKQIAEGTPIEVFNNGEHTRDFTYIDDVVDGVLRASDAVPAPNPDWRGDTPDPATSSAPFRIYNVGNSSRVQLGAFIEAIEAALGRKAIRKMLPMQPGDVPDTFADVRDIAADLGYRPSTPVTEGVRRLVAWYLAFHDGRSA